MVVHASTRSGRCVFLWYLYNRGRGQTICRVPSLFTGLGPIYTERRRVRGGRIVRVRLFSICVVHVLASYCRVSVFPRAILGRFRSEGFVIGCGWINRGVASHPVVPRYQNCSSLFLVSTFQCSLLVFATATLLVSASAVLWA